MGKKLQPSHNTHQIDEHNRGEWNRTLPLAMTSWSKLFKDFHNTEFTKEIEKLMPIRLAQVHLILQDSRDHRPDHRSSIQTHPKDYKIAPEAGSSRLIRERMLKLQQSRRVTMTCAGIHPKALTCVNRIGMEKLIE